MTHLPEDLIIDILLRLPVKSLIQFRSVCKQWNATITSSSFIKEHFHHQSNCTRLLVCWHGLVSRSPSGCLHDVAAVTLFSEETLESHKEEEPDHLKVPGLLWDLRGPCNGIFCVLDRKYKPFLWNPATRRMRPLSPDPEMWYGFDDFGLGVDPLTDEFKVVFIYCGNNSGGIPKNFCVYTSSNDSWRYLEQESLLDSEAVAIRSSCTTFLNGFYYWRKWNCDLCYSSILAFDLHNEVFQEIEMMPENLNSREDGVLCINNDSLALLSYDSYVVNGPIDIWVMKEKKDWTKLLTVVLPFGFDRPLGFWKMNKIFLSTNNLMIYDPESDDLRTLKLEKLEDVHHFGAWPFPYKESLVSLKNGHIIQDYDTQSVEIRELFHHVNLLELV